MLVLNCRVMGRYSEGPALAGGTLGKGLCKVAGCSADVFAKQMCQPHYNRNRLYGDPNYEKPKRETFQCSVTECDRTATSRGWCEKHYTRWKRHRSVAELEPRECEICGDLFDPPGIRSAVCGKPECVKKRKLQNNAKSLKNRPKKVYERTCIGCGKDFSITSRGVKYCSIKCPGRPEHSWTPLKTAIAEKNYPEIIEILKGRTAEDENGCWIWQGGYATSTHYPQVGFNKAPPGMAKTFLVHRLMLEARTQGPIKGMHAHHTCAQSACVNPAHLELATAAENVGEMMARRSYEAQVTALKAALAEYAPNHPLLK